MKTLERDQGARRRAARGVAADRAAAGAGADALRHPRRRAQLLVRVYPDELHLDGHEPALTAAEVGVGADALGADLAGGARQGGARRPGRSSPSASARRRAAWIARKLTPTNLKARPATPPVFPDPGPLRAEDDARPVAARGAAGPLGRDRLPRRASACCSRPARRSPRRSRSARLRRRAAAGAGRRRAAARRGHALARRLRRRPRRSAWASGSR